MNVRFLPFPDGTAIRWEFCGKRANELKLLLDQLVCAPTHCELPIMETIRVFDAERSEVNAWNFDTVISCDRGLAVRMIPDFPLIEVASVSDIPDSPGDVRNIMRRLFACAMYRVLNEHQYLLLHGALLAHNGGGYVLCGGSGAGKSTSASFASKEWSALADDMVLLSMVDNHWYAQPMPTWSQFCPPQVKRRVNWCQAVELQGICRLIQAEIHQLEPLSMPWGTMIIAQAFGDLRFDFGQGSFVALSQSALTKIVMLSRAVYVGNLYFSKDDGFLPLLKSIHYKE